MEDINGNNESNSPNGETNYQYDKWKNLGEKVKETVEDYHPLEGLSNRTLQAILDTEKANPTDREVATQELRRRQENGDYDSHNSDTSIREDFANNYIGIADGRIYAPTEEYKKFRDDRIKNKNNGENAKWYKETQREPLMSLAETKSSFDQTREIIDDILNKYCNPKDLGRKVGRAYINVYRLGLAKDNVEEPMVDEVCRNLNLKMHELGEGYIRAGKNSRLARIATDFFRDHQTELIKDSVSEVLEKTDIREKSKKPLNM